MSHICKMIQTIRWKTWSVTITIDESNPIMDHDNTIEDLGGQFLSTVKSSKDTAPQRTVILSGQGSQLMEDSGSASDDVLNTGFIAEDIEFDSDPIE